MSSRERVSILITSFNAEQTIERAVRSALGQNWPDLEIIIADDASSDRSLALLERLAGNDSRIQVIAKRRNGGVAAARNTLLAAATGTFVAFFDDDDWSHPGRVACQVARLKGYEAAHGAELAICYAARLQHLPDGSRAIVKPLGLEHAAPCHGASVARLILTGRPVAPGRSGRGACATCSVLARRDVFDRLGRFDAAFRRSEDTEFNLRLALAGGHFVGISRPLVEQAISIGDHKTAERELEFQRLLFRKHRGAFPSPRWHSFMATWIEARLSVAERHLLAAAWALAQLTVTMPDLLARKLAWAVSGRIDLGRRLPLSFVVTALQKRKAASP